MDAQLSYVGIIKSPLKHLKNCPKQGSEDGVHARIEIFEPYRECLKGITPGSKLIILTWLHKSDRNCLCVHPRANPGNPLTGVFLTRSPNRPNPIGLHEVNVLESDSQHLIVTPLEVLDNTPVVDIKVQWPSNP
ncbi:MAG: tRNA (N6-threonylcarbamoyladenosine(37)-N6)-methyltransferase TrmO [Desulfobacter sp.]|nr:tRNA (N6-threonylcarbamoyladenosine(37)-N6)-methyltransferase TrmO [Desulfobacter sp.]WDP86234.1 MAG: tRNA (N6-threonylcarbamoyladenosine(37)-N6)-methyltransferase TrmO [Desulfobacter sp.]